MVFLPTSLRALLPMTFLFVFHMNQYPKWLLALDFPNVIIPIGTMIFYLFGNLNLLGHYDFWLFNFLAYVVTQLLWIFPVGCFFLTLYLWGTIQEKASVIVASVGLLVSITSVLLLIL